MSVLGLKFIVDGSAELVMHPARFQILRHLQKASGPQFVEQIANAVDVHPRMVSHHLDVLEEDGLVDCRYDLATTEGSKKRRVAVRLCTATPRANEVFKDIEKTLRGKEP